MNRSTGIGRLFRADREEARAEVVRALTRTGAHITHTAAMLGILRMQMYRILWREALWTEVDQIRAAPKTKNGLVGAARSALLSKHGVQASRIGAAGAAVSGGGGRSDHSRAASGRDERGGGGDVGLRAHHLQAVVQGAARIRAGGRGR